ncbi:hypothetical protein D3C81_1335590 [compost metagenome]
MVEFTAKYSLPAPPFWMLSMRLLTLTMEPSIAASASVTLPSVCWLLVPALLMEVTVKLAALHCPVLLLYCIVPPMAEATALLVAAS